MCGIFCQLRRNGGPPDRRVHEFLRRRGPDAFGEHSVHLHDRDVTLHFISTVLALRGRHVIKQPLVDADTGSVLCWNGEAWKLHDAPVVGNDTKVVFDLLLNAAKVPKHSAAQHDAATSVVQALSRIRGPFAFVFYDARSQSLFFARDCLGRRSLVQSGLNTGSLTISSICDLNVSHDWTEVEADGVYLVRLSQAADPANSSPQQHDPVFTPTRLPHLYEFPTVNQGRADPVPSEVPDTAVETLRSVLLRALAARATDIRRYVDSQTSISAEPPRSAEVAVLFSGGLDCTVLARMLHDILPRSVPIDLLNVAFENPRIHRSCTVGLDDSADSPYEMCPDRVTARKSHAELQALCPDRKWNLVEIDVPYADTLDNRDTVKALIHPHNTEMDLSIAIALYFAARGAGYIKTRDARIAYSSPARVLLSGLGADELFGGYQRHGTAFARQGPTGLLAELELDFSRLGKRNLGRDDRVISHWGKEVRFPYLDEDLVAWALAAPVWHKCGFGLPGVDSAEHGPLDPEKRVLRLLAWKLGLAGVSAEKKRAIQFGTRSAKMETGKVKGTQQIS